MTDGSPMDPNREKFREHLLQEQRETAEAIEQTRQSAAPVELDQTRVGRVSRVDALQQQALARGLLERLITRKRKIEAALARVDAGSYGLCCACQEDIEPGRLQADPAVVFCQRCAAERQ